MTPTTNPENTHALDRSAMAPLLICMKLISPKIITDTSLISWINRSCVPRICTIFYILGVKYGHGFGQARFPGKVHRRNGWRWFVQVIPNSEGLGGNDRESVHLRCTGWVVICLGKCL